MIACNGTVAGKEFSDEVSEIVERILNEDVKVNVQPGKLPSKAEIEQLNTYVNPVTKIVKALKARGLDNKEIVEILKRYNLGWDPRTGAAWREFKKPSEKELSYLKTLKPLSKNNNDVSINQISGQANQVMEVIPDDIYRGINTNLKPSEMRLESDGTVQHVITTHVGRTLVNESCWTEAGVVRWLVDGEPSDIWIFTFDNDEGQWKWHGTTNSSTFTNYIIYVTDQVDAWGYIYHIWINEEWVRSGHLWYRENNVDQANEVWTDTGSYTDDYGVAKHDDPFLYIQDYAVWWDDNVRTEWWHSPTNQCPVKEYHELEGSSWAYWTWI
ncbi:hypothetical protein [Ferroglobus placidus]|uniref:hypothetical protein n=1 Tax=Ferroglobus placidus TaxID=54261 RepID=UPI0011D0518C|nr:hypothetical protein [Ferroglobus placidus]